MIKECPVILNNDAITVVKFNGEEVQFPSIQKDEKKVSVKFEDGKYTIVDHAEEADPFVKHEVEQVKIKPKKKTIKAEPEKPVEE